jgi:hypothetical protein
MLRKSTGEFERKRPPGRHITVSEINIETDRMIISKIVWAAFVWLRLWAT